MNIMALDIEVPDTPQAVLDRLRCALPSRRDWNNAGRPENVPLVGRIGSHNFSAQCPRARRPRPILNATVANTGKGSRIRGAVTVRRGVGSAHALVFLGWFLLSVIIWMPPTNNPIPGEIVLTTIAVAVGLMLSLLNREAKRKTEGDAQVLHEQLIQILTDDSSESVRN